jgi:hypothetical protein
VLNEINLMAHLPAHLFDGLLLLGAGRQQLLKQQRRTQGPLPTSNKAVLQSVYSSYGHQSPRAMPLTVRLDTETELCLNDLLAETGQDRSSLIRQLIRERWKQRQPCPSITQQIGGHPGNFLDTLPPSSAERKHRRRLLGQELAARRTERR